ncbi:TPA_asm: UL53.5 sORF 2 [Human alphaherpesvirus 1]|nr:TPA_asm: UL53.5 sORF 2 [Human alphaherpesvirus 1]
MAPKTVYHTSTRPYAVIKTTVERCCRERTASMACRRQW